MSGRSFIVRRASIDDLDRLAPLFAKYREFYGKEDGEVARCEVFLRERLARGESVVFVAEAVPGGVHDPARGTQGPDDLCSPLLGFAQLYPTFTSVGLARVWHLNDLYVPLHHRRDGIGSALVQHCIAFARRDGAARLTLETQHENAPARALYERLGFILGTKFVKYGMKF